MLKTAASDGVTQPATSRPEFSGAASLLASRRTPRLNKNVIDASWELY